MVNSSFQIGASHSKEAESSWSIHLLLGPKQMFTATHHALSSTNDSSSTSVLYTLHVMAGSAPTKYQPTSSPRPTMRFHAVSLQALRWCTPHSVVECAKTF